MGLIITQTRFVCMLPAFPGPTFNHERVNHIMIEQLKIIMPHPKARERGEEEEEEARWAKWMGLKEVQRWSGESEREGERECA